MLTTKQYKAKKRKLYGGVDKEQALRDGFRYEVSSNADKITWRKEGVSLLFHLSEVKYLNNRRLYNLWVFAKEGDFYIVDLSEGMVQYKGYQFELDHPFQCDRRPSGLLLKVRLEEEAKENEREFFWISRDNRKIPFSQLSDSHIANIFGKVPDLVREGLKKEAKKRFGGVTVTSHLAKSVGCCSRGIRYFKRRYGLEEEKTSLAFLIDRMDFEPNFLGKVIKKAILITS